MKLGAIGQCAMAAFLLAAFIHLDWHLARPAHHHLSLGWAYHWLSAIPVFALFAWYIHRRWPESAIRTSVVIVIGAGLLAQAVEPAGEMLSGAPLSWAFGPERLRVFAVYLGAGLATVTITLLWLRLRDGTSMEDTAPALQDFVRGVLAGDFSRLAPAFEGERPLARLWDERGEFAALPDVRSEALTCACFLGQLRAAEYFLTQGVDPTAGDATGLNALHWAANRGQIGAVRLLLRAGTSLETRSIHEGTALGTAVWSAVHEPRPAHAQIIEELLQAGARVEDAGYPSGDASIDAILLRSATGRI